MVGPSQLSALRSHMSSMAERKQKDYNHQSLISADNNNTIIEYLYSYSLLYLSQFNCFQFILARLVYVYMYDGQEFELGFAQMALDLILPELPL